MVRVVLGPDRALAFDLSGGGFGRGAHVHAHCLEKACKGGFARAFKTAVEADEPALRAQLKEAAERRIVGLLAGARRAKRLAIGADAAVEAIANGAFAVVASDAGSIARRREVELAVKEGRAIAFGDKRTLGALCGLEEVALLGVTDAPLAQQVKRCMEWRA
jgi:ribosomal protein L7Ae-like RNA K-turn-binding protein